MAAVFIDLDGKRYELAPLLPADIFDLEKRCAPSLKKPHTPTGVELSDWLDTEDGAAHSFHIQAGRNNSGFTLAMARAVVKRMGLKAALVRRDESAEGTALKARYDAGVQAGEIAPADLSNVA